MKKLLLVAILMLALVITAVACTGTPDEPDTSADDVTTAETPTDEPDVTAEPTDEPDVTTPDEPNETTAEPDVTTEEPDAPVTTEPVTTEEPTVNPADPAWIIDAEGLAALTQSNAATVELNDAGYASFTATDGDPWFLVCGNIGTMPNYLAIRYRTNTTQSGEIFIGSGAGPAAGASFTYNYNNNGEWNLLVFDLASCVSSITDGVIGHIRFDFYTGGSEEGAFLDVEYMAFFNTAEYAQAYDFDLHKAPMWDADKAVVVHQSFDQFYYGNGHQDDAVNNNLNLYHAVNNPDWNKVADMTNSEYDCLTYWGWVALKSETVGQFGYQVNGGSAIYNDEWTHETEQPVIDACVSFGGATGSRMKIIISTAGLAEGENSVRVLYKDAEGNEVCLNEITIIMPKKPFEVPAHTEETILLGDRAGGGPYSGSDRTFGQRFNIGENFLLNISITDMATYSDGNVNQWALKVWQWDTDYATTVAAEPLYATTGENHKDNTTLSVNIPAEAGIMGDIYYEIEYVDGSKQFTGWTALGTVAEGVETYVSGSLKEGTYASTIVVGVPTTDPVYKDYTANETINWKADGITVDGQINDWAGLTVSTITADKFVSWNGEVPADYNMIAGFAADADYLYAVVYVTDDVLVSGNKETDGYNGDVLQLALTLKGGKQAWYSFSYKAEGANYVIDTANKVMEGSEVATVALEGGWLAEVKLPISTLFANAEITATNFDAANPWTMEVLVCNIDRDADAETIATAAGTFIGNEAWKDNGFTLKLNWAEGIEINHGVAIAESLVIPQDQWVISGHKTTIVYANSDDPNKDMVAAGGVDSAALLHQGSIALGEIDLSKYSKVVIYWGSDNGAGTQDLYAKNENNRFMLVNADKSNQMSPNEDTIIASADYELHGWAVAPIEIDLTNVDYNGPVYLTHDSLTGGFALIYSIEFFA